MTNIKEPKLLLPKPHTADDITSVSELDTTVTSLLSGTVAAHPENHPIRARPSWDQTYLQPFPAQSDPSPSSVRIRPRTHSAELPTRHSPTSPLRSNHTPPLPQSNCTPPLPKPTCTCNCTQPLARSTHTPPLRPNRIPLLPLPKPTYKKSYPNTSQIHGVPVDRPAARSDLVPALSRTAQSDCGYTADSGYKPVQSEFVHNRSDSQYNLIQSNHAYNPVESDSVYRAPQLVSAYNPIQSDSGHSPSQSDSECTPYQSDSEHNSAHNYSVPVHSPDTINPVYFPPNSQDTEEQQPPCLDRSHPIQENTTISSARSKPAQSTPTAQQKNLTQKKSGSVEIIRAQGIKRKPVAAKERVKVLILDNPPPKSVSILPRPFPQNIPAEDIAATGEIETSIKEIQLDQNDVDPGKLQLSGAEYNLPKDNLISAHWQNCPSELSNRENPTNTIPKPGSEGGDCLVIIQEKSPQKAIRNTFESDCYVSIPERDSNYDDRCIAFKDSLTSDTDCVIIEDKSKSDSVSHLLILGQESDSVVNVLDTSILRLNRSDKSKKEAKAGSSLFERFSPLSSSVRELESEDLQNPNLRVTVTLNRDSKGRSVHCEDTSVVAQQKCEQETASSSVERQSAETSNSITEDSHNTVGLKERIYKELAAASSATFASLIDLLLENCSETDEMASPKKLILTPSAKAKVSSLLRQSPSAKKYLETVIVLDDCDTETSKTAVEVSKPERAATQAVSASRPESIQEQDKQRVKIPKQTLDSALTVSSEMSSSEPLAERNKTYTETPKQKETAPASVLEVTGSSLTSSVSASGQSSKRIQDEIENNTEEFDFDIDDMENNDELDENTEENLMLDDSNDKGNLRDQAEDHVEEPSKDRTENQSEEQTKDQAENPSEDQEQAHAVNKLKDHTKDTLEYRVKSEVDEVENMVSGMAITRNVKTENATDDVPHRKERSTASRQLFSIGECLLVFILLSSQYSKTSSC